MTTRSERLKESRLKAGLSQKQVADAVGMKQPSYSYLEKNDNKDTIIQNLWDTAKAILRGKFIAIQSFLRKEEKMQINNLPLPLKHLEKEEQTKPKISRRKKCE